MCPNAGVCSAICLSHAGQNQLNTSKKARVRRTLAYKEDFQLVREVALTKFGEGRTPEALESSEFLQGVRREIAFAEAWAKANNMKLAVRPNILSDQRSLGLAIARMFPHLPVYDYTKIGLGLKKEWVGTMPENYSLTFSLDERNAVTARNMMLLGVANVAVVFDLGRGDDLPREWSLPNEAETTRPVVDGDVNDLRFLDPKGVFIGLRFKGSKANRATARRLGFIHNPNV